jgi:hypothetical protein
VPNERSARVIGGLDAAPVGPVGFIEQLPGQPFESPSGVEVVSRLDLCYIRGEMSRRVVKRSNTRSTGKFPSWKMEQMVEFESRNEFAAFCHLEFDADVHRYWAQPCIVHYRDQGTGRVHYPDICIDYGSRKELWEVKSASDMQDQDLIRRTGLLTTALPEHGFEYRLVLGEDLMRQPHYDNIKLLLKARRRTVSIECFEHIRQIALTLKRLRWHEAKAGLYGPDGRAILSSLAISGHLSVDLSRRIEVDAEFHLRGE